MDRNYEGRPLDKMQDKATRKWFRKVWGFTPTEEAVDALNWAIVLLSEQMQDVRNG